MQYRLKFPTNIPWFMYDLYNQQLITSATIPEGDITDSKSVVVTETPIPGRNFQPVSVGGNGNRKVSFTLPVINRNGYVGNLLMLKQFDLLRNQAQGPLGLSKSKGQFSPNPRVLYYWGVGSVPLVWYVTKCDFRHSSGMVNALASPQLTYVEIELLLDETDPLYKAEEAYRNVAAVLGEAMATAAVGVQQVGMGSPF